MNSRIFWTIILVLTIATAAVESILPSLEGGLIPTSQMGMSLPTCDAMDGHCFNADADFMMEADLVGDHGRLLLAPGRQRYISYRALRANKIPCGQQGSSYYDCSKMQKVNPYRRGCGTVTRCYRFTH